MGCHYILNALVEADQALVCLTFDSIIWIEECSRLVGI